MFQLADVGRFIRVCGKLTQFDLHITLFFVTYFDKTFKELATSKRLNCKNEMTKTFLLKIILTQNVKIGVFVLYCCYMLNKPNQNPSSFFCYSDP